MNSNDSSSPLPPSDTNNDITSDETQPPPFLPKIATHTLEAGTTRDPYWLLKWFLVQNPFYIASAIMLLYSMFRLSTDPRMFAEEVSQLFFNFGSFQVYELMVTVTAVVLARRKILYDFSLLVCIETIFSYVPFILISQALLIEGELAIALSLIGILLVLLRFKRLHAYFEGMNFPARLLALGGVLLVINVALPLVVRYVHMGSTPLNRDLRMNPLIEALWLFGAPLFAALAYFLPAPRRIGAHLLQRRTFPITALSLWVLVTCAHLYCVGYIHQIGWNIALITPVLSVAGWMLYLRMNDVFEQPGEELKNFLLIPAGAMTLVAAYAHNWPIFFTLNLLNAVIYSTVFIKQRSAFAFHLATIAFSAALAGLPDQIIARLELDLNRSMCIGLASTAFIIFRSVLSRSPVAGVIGGTVATIATAVFFRHSQEYANVGAQVGIVFLLLHSLRWDMSIDGTRAVRVAAAIFWVLHSTIWVSHANPIATWATSSFALLALTTHFAIRAIFGAWSSRLVPYAALLVLVCNPLWKLIAQIEDAPMGVIILAASFVLFALGTALALTRHRWLHLSGTNSNTVPSK